MTDFNDLHELFSPIEAPFELQLDPICTSPIKQDKPQSILLDSPTRIPRFFTRLNGFLRDNNIRARQFFLSMMNSTNESKAIKTEEFILGMKEYHFRVSSSS